MDKIFIYACAPKDGGFVISYAIDKNQETLAIHMSSSLEWAKHDMGIGSDWKHDVYKEKYPNGYDLVWLGLLNTAEEFVRVAGESGVNMGVLTE